MLQDKNYGINTLTQVSTGVTSKYSATPRNVHPVRRDHVSSGRSPEAINNRKIQTVRGGRLRCPGGALDPCLGIGVLMRV